MSKVFRDFWLRHRVRAVSDMDLEVGRGEVFGLLGPNGSGKSTTTKMILGLLYPTSGRIAVFGKRPEDVATKKLIGYLPEDTNLYPFLNARETLDYYGRLFHQDRRRRQRRIDMLLDMVGLEGAQRRPIGHYSKGMQRRVGLAAALINDPQLLILDEPTNGLDPLGTRQIKDLILELSRRRKTILLCSHLLADVEDVCTRLAIMFGGRIRVTGSVKQLLVRQDATTIQTSGLDGDTIQKVESLLQSCGANIEKIEKPRQKLEAMFLDIIHQAQAEGAATSGVRIGGQIAGFLKDQPGRSSSETGGQPRQAADRQTPAPRTARPIGSQRARPPSPGQPRVQPDRASQTPETPPAAGAVAGSVLQGSEDVSVIDRLVRAETTRAGSDPPERGAAAPAGGDAFGPGEASAGEPSPTVADQTAAEPAPSDEPPRRKKASPEGDEATGRPAGSRPPQALQRSPGEADPKSERPYEGFSEAVDDVKPFVPDEQGVEEE